MTFALIGDWQYRECMELNISQIRKFYAGSKIVIGDLGKNSNWGYPVMKLTEQTDRECLMMMKPLFLLNCVYQYGQTCLMDGDTVLMQRLDLSGNVVTVRKSRHGRINSGVVLADDTDFVNAWLSKAISRLGVANISVEQLCEQNALIDVADSGKFDIQEVPCEIYNYSSVEKGIPDNVRIVHLKSGRFRKPEMMKTVYEAIDKNS